MKSPYGTLSRCAGTSILQVELVLVQLPGSEPSNDAWTVSKPKGPFRRINFMNLEKTLAQVGDDGRRIPMTLGRGQVLFGCFLNGWPLLT